MKTPFESKRTRKNRTRNSPTNRLRSKVRSLFQAIETRSLLMILYRSRPRPIPKGRQLKMVIG